MRPTNFEEPKIKTMDFGQALEALKDGRRVTRLAWVGNGNQFLYYVGDGRYEPTTQTGVLIALEHPDGKVPYRPYIALFTESQDVMPWTATQSDLLDEDWVVMS